MRYVPRHKLTDSDCRQHSETELSEMVTTHHYYSDVEIKLSDAVDAIFSVLSDSQKNEVARIVGYIPISYRVGFEKLKDVIDRIRKITPGYKKIVVTKSTIEVFFEEKPSSSDIKMKPLVDLKLGTISLKTFEHLFDPDEYGIKIELYAKSELQEIAESLVKLEGDKLEFE